MLKASIITPTTADRAEFNERIKRIAKAQDYPNIEHILCYDNETIGTKRNRLCSEATGDIIVMFDSDDLYESDYVSRCVEQLQHCDVTGVIKCYFTDFNNAWLYHYTAFHNQPLVMGSGMAFHKRVWQHNPFRNTSVGEDLAFCTNAGSIQYIDGGMIATLHGKNTASHKQLHHMKRQSLDETKNILETANKIINLAYANGSFEL